MISIREKEINEVHNEVNQNLANGVKKEICLTYIIDNDGTRIDTNDLSEKKIISLIKDDLMDFYAEEGSYKKEYRTRPDSFALAPLVKDKFLPSVHGAYELYKLIPVYGEVVLKILNDFGYMHIIQRTIIIANFFKESHNDFNAITYKEMMIVLEQMTNNESEREYNLQRRLK